MIACGSEPAAIVLAYLVVVFAICAIVWMAWTFKD